MLCNLVLRWEKPIRDVYDFLIDYPYTQELGIARDLSYREFRYAWNHLILEDGIRPIGSQSPNIVVQALDEDRLRMVNTQFERWQLSRANDQDMWEIYSQEQLSFDCWYRREG